MGHLKDVDMTWSKHFIQAWGYIFGMIKVMLKLVVHSFFPNVWPDTGVKKVLNEEPTKNVLSYSNRNTVK